MQTEHILCYFTNTPAAAKTVALDLSGGPDPYELLLLDDEKNAEPAGIVSAGGTLTLQPNTAALLQSM